MPHAVDDEIRRASDTSGTDSDTIFSSNEDHHIVYGGPVEAVIFALDQDHYMIYSPQEEPVAAPEALDEPQDIPICPKCPRTFNQPEALAQHLRDVHVGTQCNWPRCGITTTTEEELRQHLIEHNNAIADQRRGDRTRCYWPGCGQEFTRPVTAQRCVRRHNSEAGGQD
ncbi:hypothetical protein F5Y19DRAFT_382699 [Xylariaceae sp. FL1651]|nr:hypothetical protein F5Y19DRAFT_382699 [Xylariaceae sp. FL1651]